VYRRQFLAAAATVPLAGCASLTGGDDEPSRLDLTVQNERPEPVTVDVSVVGDDGTTYESTSDQVDSGVARAFEVPVGTSGRHEATVSGDDWEGRVAWQAGTCSLFDGRVLVTPEAVEVASECVQQR
jgi:hypothetical protein